MRARYKDRCQKSTNGVGVVTPLQMLYIYKKMLNINNWPLKKQYVIGGSGMLDIILQFLIKTFTSQAAKNLASSAAKKDRK